MIPIGARVRCKNEVRVEYGPGRPDDVVPPGSTGEVRYRPKDEDPDASFEIGVLWTRPDGTLCGIEVNEKEVDVLLDHKSFSSIPPFETLVALKRLLHYSWRDIAYEHDGLTKSEKAALSPEQMALLKKWISPEVGTEVVATKTIVESGTDALGDAGAKPLAPNWIHATAGDKGKIEDFNADMIPTVRFERTGTATIVDWSEIEW